MSTTCDDVYLGLLDEGYYGLLGDDNFSLLGVGDDDPCPPPLPQGFDPPRKPPVNAAAHFCQTRRRDNHAAAEHCDVGEYCSPNLKSGSKEERDGCGVGAGHYQMRGRGKWSNGGIASFLDKDTERFDHLHEGNSRAYDVKTGHQQQQNDKSCAAPSTVGFRLGPLFCPRWKRALLKIGGNVLAGSASENVDPKMITLIAREVQAASLCGVQVAIVVGSQNIYCGDTWAVETGIERAAACPIGMMASVMNAVLLQASLEKIGIEARVQTTLVMQDATEPYIRRQAMRHLEKGRVVIFGGIGAAMGNPLLTTDTAAALRASEINADVLLKGLTGDAESEHISYRKLVARRFSEMDVKAISFCKENNIPFVLFNMLEPGNISRALCGDQVGTLVDQTGRKDQLT